MKFLQKPEPCTVQQERGHVVAVRWRDRVWQVKTTLDIWTYRGNWWTDPSLEGERRQYHVLGTSRGEIEVYERTCPDPQQFGWWVSAWWD
jgi:hypothetical protein